MFNFPWLQVQRDMPGWWSTDRLRVIKQSFALIDADGADTLYIQEAEELFRHIITVYLAVESVDPMG